MSIDRYRRRGYLESVRQTLVADSTRSRMLLFPCQQSHGLELPHQWFLRLNAQCQWLADFGPIESRLAKPRYSDSLQTLPVELAYRKVCRSCDLPPSEYGVHPVYWHSDIRSVAPKSGV